MKKTTQSLVRVQYAVFDTAAAAAAAGFPASEWGEWQRHAGAPVSWGWIALGAENEFPDVP